MNGFALSSGAAGTGVVVVVGASVAVGAAVVDAAVDDVVADAVDDVLDDVVAAGADVVGSVAIGATVVVGAAEGSLFFESSLHAASTIATEPTRNIRRDIGWEIGWEIG